MIDIAAFKLPVRPLAAAALTVALLSAAGCASHPHSIEAQSVSNHQFRHLECAEVIQEIQRVDNRGEALHKSLSKEAYWDEGQMFLGLTIFWPALLLLEGGDSPEAAEYARLKGEYPELVAEATRRNCDMSSAPAEPFYERR